MKLYYFFVVLTLWQTYISTYTWSIHNNTNERLVVFLNSILGKNYIKGILPGKTEVINTGLTCVKGIYVKVYYKTGEISGSEKSVPGIACKGYTVEVTIDPKVYVSDAKISSLKKYNPQNLHVSYK